MAHLTLARSWYIAAMTTGRRTRVAAYAVCVQGGAMLLVRLAETTGAGGRWAVPGGGLDWGESPREAVAAWIPLAQIRELPIVDTVTDALGFVDRE